MTTLADALRALLAAPIPCDCGIQGCGRRDCPETERERLERAAREALAAHDAAVAAGGWKAGQYAPDESLQPLVRIWNERGDLIADVRADRNGQVNAARIVECVNACTGIADPALAIQAARTLIYGGDNAHQQAIDSAHAAGIARL